jgi:hypothetical protein
MERERQGESEKGREGEREKERKCREKKKAGERAGGGKGRMYVCTHMTLLKPSRLREQKTNVGSEGYLGGWLKYTETK